jgi:hypothetical protein
MLLRRRAPRIEHRSAHPAEGFEHLTTGWIAVLRWLTANEIDFVLVGPVAQAIRGQRDATGAVAIVPAPYGRNYDRLERALWAAHARQRAEHAVEGEQDTVPVKITADKLARGQRWALRCGTDNLDIEALSPAPEGNGDPAPGYQELLYEANRFTVADGVAVEVASPEDIEHYAHVARTGRPPTMRITRGVPVGNAPAASDATA